MGLQLTEDDAYPDRRGRSGSRALRGLERSREERRIYRAVWKSDQEVADKSRPETAMEFNQSSDILP